jgi:hypothetical protein
MQPMLGRNPLRHRGVGPFRITVHPRAPIPRASWAVLTPLAPRLAAPANGPVGIFYGECGGILFPGWGFVSIASFRTMVSFSVFLLGVGGQAARAQDIAVSGKVVDAAGKPLAGAVVRLLAARLADTTGADGRFDFAGKSIGVLEKPRNLESIRSEGNRLVFEAGSGADVEITLHDLRGARVALVFRGRAQAGRNSIPFDMDGPGNRMGKGSLGGRLGKGPLWLRIRIGGRESVLPVGRDGLLGPVVTSALGKPAAPSAARASASAAAVDWLQAYKPGYAAYAGQIAAYAGEHPITLGPLTAPDFGPNVSVFDPAMPMADIQARIMAIHALQSSASTSQFSADRYALLFKPGAYSLNVDVGYYTQALGLGALPGGVAITGSVRSISTTANNNVTLMFWRGAENMAVTPPAGAAANIWAVSQGVSFRRMHVKGSLALSLNGWASGGFLADTKVDGQVNPGSQQQWYSRNSELGSWAGGVWNMSFTGVVNAPAGAWPAKPYTVIAQAPRVREKPFLYADMAGKYFVMVPALRENAAGTSWSQGPPAGESIPLELFHIAHPETDDAAALNAALAAGKHLLFTPGIYRLSQALRIASPGTVVLGLGLPTLVPDNGTAAVSIADVDGVKVAGLVIDAGPMESPVLLQAGDAPGTAGAGKDHSANPTSLHDIYLRVGGGRAGSAVTSVILNSNDVIGDHFWVWRADHGAGAGWASNKGANGLIVNGDRVTCYGLFVEHYQEYQTIWNGEGGQVHFYQSELPYDPPAQDAWQHGGVNGWASYKVADKVKTHEAWGLGVYCAFKAPGIRSDHAIEAPAVPGVQIRHAVSIWLNGAEGTGIGNVLNATGGEATKAKPKATID